MSGVVGVVHDWHSSLVVVSPCKSNDQRHISLQAIHLGRLQITINPLGDIAFVVYNLYLWPNSRRNLQGRHRGNITTQAIYSDVPARLDNDMIFTQISTTTQPFGM